VDGRGGRATRLQRWWGGSFGGGAQLGRACAGGVRLGEAVLGVAEVGDGVGERGEGGQEREDLGGLVAGGAAGHCDEVRCV